MSQEPCELIHAKSSLTDDRAQSTPVKFLVIRYNQLGQGAIPA